MSRHLILLVCFFISKSVLGQSATINGANIDALLNANGSFFFDDENGVGAFEAPAGSQNLAILATFPWVGGIDDNGEIRVAKNDFGCWSGNGWDCGYKAGPRTNTNPSTWNETIGAEYGGVFIVTAEMIEEHTVYFDCLNNPGCDIDELFPNGYSVHPNIAAWPGSGDPSLGVAPNLAPYFDYNGDGVYNPELGDRPEICGDITAFTMFNDSATTGGASLWPQIGLEVHATVYAYYDQSQAADNTLFIKLKLINKGPHTLNQTHVGLWTDTELGNYTDDRIATDVERSMFYTYNGDLFDEPSGAGPGYGSDLGILGIRTLEGVYADSDGSDGTPLPEPYARYGDKTSGWGDGIADNERLGMSRAIYHSNPGGGIPPATNDAVFPLDYLNFMRGIWKDGTPLIYGENVGYYPDGGLQTRYVFPGESDPLHWGTDGVNPDAIWTEESIGMSPSDRRGLISSGPFTFAPGDVQYIDYAFIFARDSQNPDEDVLTTLRAYADEVVNLTCENLPDVIVSNSEASQIKTSVQLYPNPSADVATIAIQPATYGTYTITDLSGRKIASGIISGSETRLDLTTLSNGMYIVAIETENTQTSRKLLVGN